MSTGFLSAAPGAPVPVGEATAAALTRVGGTTVFGVGGTHTVPLLGAFERSGTIDFVAARTELGAAYMAIGYARATGRPGVVLTSTGPGALNAAAALADAAWSSLPLLHVTTSIGGTGFAGAVHETPAQSEILRLAGGAVVPTVDDAVDAAVDEAWTVATGRPTGPVTLVLPAGRWNEPARASAGPAPIRPAPRSGDAADLSIPDHSDEDAALAALAAALTAAERPLLYAGGGAVRHDGGAAVRRLAETIGAPIVTSYQGKGIAGPAHPLWFGPTSSEAAVRECCARADVAVVFGANLSAAGTDQWRLPLPEQVWRVGYERRPHPHYPQLQEIHADAAAAADGLAARLAPRPPWADVAAVRADVDAGARRRGGLEMEFVDALREAPGTAALVRERADSLARLATLEEGKPFAEAKGEVLATAALLDFHAGEAVRVYGRVLPDQAPAGRRRRAPRLLRLPGHGDRPPDGHRHGGRHRGRRPRRRRRRSAADEPGRARRRRRAAASGHDPRDRGRRLRHAGRERRRRRRQPAPRRRTVEPRPPGPGARLWVRLRRGRGSS